MTKTLLLLRHADAEPERSALKDFDRALTEHGRSDAERAARYLGVHDLIPDKIFFSAARRARETVEKMVGCFSETPDLRESCSLYMASPEEIVEYVRRNSDGDDTIAVVAHSPGVPSLALFLSNPDENSELISQLIAGYPPAALTVLRFQQDSWAEISSNSGILENFVLPNEM